MFNKYCAFIVTSVNSVHNAPRLFVMGPDVGGGGGKGMLQTDPARFFARYFTGLSLPPPPKTSVINTETY